MGKSKTIGKPDYFNFGKYAVGGIGFSMTNQFILVYLTFFCTDIFGISSLTVAGLMLVTKIIDAVTDPLMGFIADQTRTKQGRYRPYLIYGAPILGVLVYLLFSAPELSSTMKVVFIYVVYILYSLAFTVVGVPSGEGFHGENHGRIMEKCHDSGWPFFHYNVRIAVSRSVWRRSHRLGTVRSPGGRSDYPVLLVRRVGTEAV